MSGIRANPAGRQPRPPSIEPDAPTIGDWLHIEPDSTVVVYTGKTEVGQNIRTSLAQAVAEELRLPIAAIRLVLADTARTPYDMGTVGSRSTPIMARRLHIVAASTRELLLDLAASRWGVERGELRLDGGQIHHDPSSRAIGYGELTQGQRLTQEYDEATPVTPVEQWTIAGTSAAKVDGRSIVTGQRQYTPDLARPGMLVGKVLRPPAFGAARTALDTSAAAALPGVTVVHNGDFVGVAAPDMLLAMRALAAIRAEWAVAPQIATRELFAHLRDHPAPPSADVRGGPQRHEQGSLEAGRAAAQHVLAQTYTVAYIAHAPMEPRSAWPSGMASS